MKKNAEEGWYGSGGGIARSGPFTSPDLVRKAFRLTPDALERQRKEHGTYFPYPRDFLVWHSSEEL